MPYNLCLFDLDGTLTDPKEGIIKSRRYALSSFGIEVDLNELRESIGPPLREFFREFYNFSETEVEAAVSKYREYFSKTGIFENILYAGIVDMLAQLKDNGVITAITTSKPTVFAEKIAVHFGLQQYFDFIIGSELDGRRSRKSEIINYVLDTIDPERKMLSVMIGDRKHDIIGAQEMGIDSIGVTWGYGSFSELEGIKPTMIANSPDELCRLILGKSI